MVASVSEAYSRYLELRSNPQCGAPLLRNRDTCEDALKITLEKHSQYHLTRTKTMTMLPESPEPIGSKNYEHLEFNRFLVADTYCGLPTDPTSKPDESEGERTSK